MLLSTSGRSPNMVAAARRARRCGLEVLAFTGPRPNPLADIASDALCVDAPFTATVQELHLVALHLVCASLDRELGLCDPLHDCDDSGGAIDSELVAGAIT